MKRTKGFTLVELLVVVAIIALLVSILLPTLSRAKELTKRVICASSLSALGKSGHIYANDYDGAFPSFDDGAEDNVNHVGYQHTNETPTKSYGNTRGWFIMVRQDYCPLGSFRCSSDSKVAKENYSVEDIYDFKPEANVAPISYGLQVTKRWEVSGDSYGILLNSSSDGGMVIAADRNGLNKWKTLGADYAQAFRDSDVVADANKPELMNSPNHGRDGQNVLLLGSSVLWRETPLCGIDDDNIWTRSDGTDLGLTGEADLKAGAPTDEDDSFLSP